MEVTNWNLRHIVLKLVCRLFLRATLRMNNKARIRVSTSERGTNITVQVAWVIRSINGYWQNHLIRLVANICPSERFVGVAGSAQWMGNMIAHIKYIWPRKPEAKKVTMPQKVNYYAEYYSYYRRCILITNRDISFTSLPNRTFHFDHAVCTLLNAI